MSTLFENDNTEIVKLREYVDWFIDKNHSWCNKIQLPPIQRGVVWNASQAERLWDSLMRGFPIGSFVLAPRKSGEYARELNSRQQKKTENGGWFLFDGQQRTRSLLLGFRPDTENHARLWIDLLPPQVFDNAEHNDRLFLFRVLTPSQPWGMMDNNPKGKIPEGTKRDHRENILAHDHYDYKIGVYVKDDCTSNFAWPLKARAPVPFDVLVSIYSNEPAEIFNEMRCWIKGKGLDENTKNEVLKNIEFISNALKRAFGDCGHNGVCKITLQRFDPNNEQPAPWIKPEDSSKIQDSVEVFFRRVNAGGTVLVGEEMMFSLLKANWDACYDLVQSVVDDQKVGYLLKPSEFVMSAVRIALQGSTNPDGKMYRDNADPTVSDFRKWIGESSFNTSIKSLLENGSNSEYSCFHQIMKKFCELAVHQGNSDPGFPRKLLLSINPVLFHPVFYWLYLRGSDDGYAELLERNRLGVLRYLMFAILGVLDKIRASMSAFEIINNCAHNDFPDVEIYKKWSTKTQDAQISTTLPSVELFSPNSIDGDLRDCDEVFGNAEDMNHVFRRRFWCEGKYWHFRGVLLWFQREYMPKWFDGYNPMREDGADTPYDFDHILPVSHIAKQNNTLKSTGDDDIGLFKKRRYLYVNSIGNLRIWPLWKNRKDGDSSPTTKLELGTISVLVDESAIESDDKNLWIDASGSPMAWSRDRRIAWQTAVENRVYYLYKTLFETLQYNKWLDNSITNNISPHP